MTRDRNRRREIHRRVVVLSLVLLALSAGLSAFYGRQSLVTTVRPYLLTRVWLPSARLSPDNAPRPGGSAKGVPVLVYHGIQPSGSSCNVTPETFIAHMNALSAAGYTTLTTEEFVAFMRGKRRFPERSVLVTFDDGRTDSFSGADPVLRRLGFHATMFTILGRTNSAKSFYLTAKETAMMAETGRWDVQSHTANSHEFVASGPLDCFGRALPTRKWDTRNARLESDAEYVARVRADLSGARTGLAALTGRPVVALAYPWGDFGRDSGDPLVRQELPKIASDLYAVTFTQAGATVDETYNYPSDFGTTLRRIYITHDLDARELMAGLERGVPKRLPFAESTSLASSGWVLSSGSFVPLGGAGRGLKLDASGRGDRAEAFLDGSRSWRDYSVGASLSLESTETVSIIVRRNGPRDYLAATVSRTYVSLEQVCEDAVSTLAEADVSLEGAKPFLAGVIVNGTRLSLKLNGVTVAQSDAVDAALEAGGIAVRLDAAGDTAPVLDLADLRVEPLSTAVSANAPAGAVPYSPEPQGVWHD